MISRNLSLWEGHNGSLRFWTCVSALVDARAQSGIPVSSGVQPERNKVPALRRHRYDVWLEAGGSALQKGSDSPKELASEERRALDQQLVDIERVGEELVAYLSFEQANWSPSPSSWSIAQCVAHISISARIYLVSIDLSIRDGWQGGLIGKDPFVYSALGRWLVRNIEPPPRFKVTTGRAYVPTPGRPVAEVLSEFIDIHEEVRQRLRSSDGLDLARCRMCHPSLRIFRFSLGVGFAIVTGHARRHLWQARHVREHAAFPVGNN